MEVIYTRIYKGRNIYSHKPIVKMIIKLGNWNEITTKNIKGFNDDLLEHFPGLYNHHCSLGFAGGFVQRLKEGTLLSHVAEHLALELQCLLGYEVYFGKTRLLEVPDKYCIVYEYINEFCALDIGEAAVEIVSALAHNRAIDIDRIICDLRKISFESKLGPSTQAIHDEARRRNIPIRRLGKNSLLQLGYGKHISYIEASLPGNISSLAVDFAKNKQMVKNLLKENNIPVPSGETVDSEGEAVVLAHEMAFPVVVKPLDANQGKGVTINISDENQLRRAYCLARDYARKVIVEKHISGKDYRVLVVGNKVAAVAERIPPFIIGDGFRPISDLVAQENDNPKRGSGHENHLSKIPLDTIAIDFLNRSGLNLNVVPEAGEKIYIRENGNLSTGGSARDCTADIHPANLDLAIKAAKAVGLSVAGIDMLANDISEPLISQNGVVVEVNAAPGLRMHLYPSEGKGRNVAADILDQLFPAGSNPSIPIISITGTNGKTTVARLIYHVLSFTDKKIGMTCSDGTYIGKTCISKGDNTGPLSAESILYNKDVEVAVLETARGGIIRKGLGYDLADIGVITNIDEDHLGVDNIDSVEDMAFVKSLVVEAIKPDGYAVLNADDEMTKLIMPKVDCNKVLFSMRRDNALLDSHIRQEGMAVVAEGGLIVLYQNKLRYEIACIIDIPITYGGTAQCNIENLLTAVASLSAYGLGKDIICEGLMSFYPNPTFNEGRFNLFDMGGYHILLDYGHNLGAYRAVTQFIDNFDATRRVGIIGAPGDRLNEAIFKLGTISGQTFSKLYIKEDEDLRGRLPGEVAEMLFRGATDGGIDSNNIEIILSETEALAAAINSARAGDLIVHFYERFDAVYELIERFKEERWLATPLASEVESIMSNSL